MTTTEQDTEKSSASADYGPKLGIALGSGSARGWAHIGVLQELEAMGIQPDVVAGTSIGAFVGGVYASGKINELAEWVETLTLRDVFGLMDFSFSGGVVKGDKLLNFFREQHPDPNISDLPIPFATVATDMELGREVWIQDGTVLDAARASCALPGLFSPYKYNGRWMLDGGLVNPVPVSVCRALGADVVISVNLNGQLVGRQFSERDRKTAETERDKADSAEKSAWERMLDYFGQDEETQSKDKAPGMFDVIGASVNIMQDRITRSRMAGEPADIPLVPLLADYAIMDFHRAKEAIAEGRRLVSDAANRIRWHLGEA